MNPENPPPDNLDDNADDQIVCPHCLHLNTPEAAFCTKCGAPIWIVANVDPMQQIYSEGFGFRSAVSGPPKRIILIGTWLVFLPSAGICLAGIYQFASFGIGTTGFALTMPLGFAISVGILYRVTRNYLVKSREARKP